MAKPQWAAIHASDVLRSLERDIFPEIGEIPIADLTQPIIYDVLKEIEDRGAVETAKSIRQRISAVFLYAIAKGLAQADPAADRKSVAEGKSVSGRLYLG